MADAQFPTAVWDGMSDDTQRVALTQIASPSGVDYQQITAEVRAAQQAIVDSGLLALSSQTRQVATQAKVGAGAGWVLGGADNLPYVATMAAGQTAGTLVIPIDGLRIGDTITGFKVNAQVESGGNVVTIDAALRAVTNVAAEPTDGLIGAGMTQVSVTVDTAVASAKTGLTEVVASGKSYYLLITATTGASCDIILQHSEITTQPAE